MMTETAVRLARNAGWLIVGEIAVKVALLATAIIIARTLGPHGLGTFSIAFAASLMATMILAAGQQEVVIREVAANPADATTSLRTARQIQRRLAAWFLPVAAAVVWCVDDRSLRYSLFAFLAYSAIRVALVTNGAAFKGIDRMDVEVKARIVEISVTLPLLAIIAVCGSPVWMIGIAFAAGATTGLTWLRTRRRTILGSAPSCPLDIGIFIREGAPFLAMAVLLQMLIRGDTMLLPLLGVPRDEVGFYSAACSPIWAVFALPQLLSVSAYPTLSKRAADGAGIRATMLAATGAAALLGCAAAAVLFLGRRPLVLGVFGTEFAASIDLLQRLVWVMPWAFVMSLGGMVLAAWRQQRWSLAAMALAVVVATSLNLMWIPRFGVFGAANSAISAHVAGGLAIVVFGLTRSNR